MKTKIIILSIVLISIFVIASMLLVIGMEWNNSFSAKKMSDEEKLSIALNIGKLSQIPKNKKDFIIDGTSNAFSTTMLFRFMATSKEIKEFINNSVSLTNVEPKSISEYKNIVYDERYPWFTPNKIKIGKVYEIPKSANFGTIYIDELNNIVYVTVSRS